MLSVLGVIDLTGYITPITDMTSAVGTAVPGLVAAGLLVGGGLFVARKGWKLFRGFAH